MDAAGVSGLLKAIRRMHGCEAIWVESVPVRETFEGETVFEDEVSVFVLIDCPKAARCYAWSRDTGSIKRRFYVALQLAPVLSAADAVRASIVVDADARKNVGGLR
jgi:hypothetical protein